MRLLKGVVMFFIRIVTPFDHHPKCSCHPVYHQMGTHDPSKVVRR